MATRDEHLEEMRGLVAWAEEEMELDVVQYMARMFPHYSYQNRMLIAAQWLKRGKAITDLHDVAGLKQFTDFGCSVKKGAKALWIYAPLLVREDKNNPESELTLVGCKITMVFGYSRNEEASEVEVKDAAKWARCSATRDAKREATYNAKVEEKAQTAVRYPVPVRKAMAVLGIDCLEGALVKAAYRAACRANHPDLGGSLETMKAINNAMDDLHTYLAGTHK